MITDQLTFRLSARDKLAIQEAARQSGMSVGAFIRDALELRDDARGSGKIRELDDRLTAIEDLLARAR